MENRKKIIITVSILTVAGIAAFVIIRRKKNKIAIQAINDILDSKVADPNQSGTQVIIPKSEYDKLPAGKFPIRFGDKGKLVYNIQVLINRKYGTTIALDGKYGDSTFQAMCSNVWNAGILSTKETACYEHGVTSGDKTKTAGLTRVRRSITQADVDKLKK